MDAADLTAQLQRSRPVVEVAQAVQRPPAETRARTVTLSDRQPYTKGAYFAWIAPWGAGTLREGRDYSETVTIDPSGFPNQSAMRWSWPGNPPKSTGVYTFLALNFGDYYGTAVQAPIAPRRLTEITALSQTHAFEIAGTRDGYDVVTDYFLTAEAGRHERHLFEIEVFWHTPPYTKGYVESVAQLGTYTDAQGRAWTVAKSPPGEHGPAILFMPAGAGTLKRATVDLQAMHVWLITRGVLTGREWFNGLAFGVEVRQDGGSMKVDELAMTYR